MCSFSILVSIDWAEGVFSHCSWSWDHPPGFIALLSLDSISKEVNFCIWLGNAQPVCSAVSVALCRLSWLTGLCQCDQHTQEKNEQLYVYVDSFLEPSLTALRNDHYIFPVSWRYTFRILSIINSNHILWRSNRLNINMEWLFFGSFKQEMDLYYINQ